MNHPLPQAVLTRKTVNCRKFRIEIEEAHRESLDSVSRAARVHLLSCASCRRFREERINLACLINDLPQSSAPSNFEFRLRARLTDSRSSRSASRAFVPSSIGFAPGALSIVLAAIFAGAGALLFYSNQNQSLNLSEGEDSVNIADAAPVAPSAAIEDTTAGEENRDGALASSDTARGDDLSSATNERVSALPISNLFVNISSRRTPATTRTTRAPQNPPQRETPVIENNSLTESSTTSDVRPATITSTLPPSSEESPTFAVAINPPTGQPRVRVRDSRGGVRMMPARSVTFGGQTLVGRNRMSSSTAQMREAKW